MSEIEDIGSGPSEGEGDGEEYTPVRHITVAEAALQLTGRRRAFADIILANPGLPYVEAARRAGYSPAAADSEGSSLMKNEKVLVYMGACLREGVGLGMEGLRYDVLKRIYAIATHDPRKTLTVKTVNKVVQKTNERTGEVTTVVEPTPIVAVKDSDQWDEATAMAVQEVSADGRAVRVKFHDKLAALGVLAKISRLLDAGVKPQVSVQTRTRSGATPDPDDPEGPVTVTEIKVTYVEGGDPETPEGVVEK